MSLLFGEQLITSGRHYQDTGVDFGPRYLHRLRGGAGPAPKTKRMDIQTSTPATIKKSRFECDMDRARNKSRKSRQRGVCS